MKLIIDIPDSDYKRIKDLVATDTRYTVATTVGTAYQVIANGIPFEEKPQGEWFFTEIDENYHVYGQCSICKERNRIGKACRSCGAEMKGGTKK